MEIDNVEIKIKKYNQEKNVLIFNIIFFKKIETRGWTVRLIEGKNGSNTVFWKLTPPSKSVRKNKFFWICRIIDKDLWQKIEEKAIEMARKYPESI